MADQSMPASEGERRALVGYVPQYRLCAEVAHAALIKGRLEWLQLLNDGAGQIDDFLVGSPNRLDAFQVKHGEEAETYTLNSLLRPGKTDRGKPTDSLFRQLAAGWLRLTSDYSDRDVHVHLVLRGIPTKIGAVEFLISDLH